MGDPSTRICTEAAPVSPSQERRDFFFVRGRAVSLALALMFPIGCGPTNVERGPVDLSAIDDAGRTVEIHGAADRVVSVVPSVTELIVALGAADRLAARTGYDTDPRMEHLPNLGRTLTPGAEAVVAFEPDLVIVGSAPRSVRLGDQIERAAPVYVADLQRIDDIYSTAARVGRLLGRSERAESFVAELRAGLEQARLRYATANPPTVLYVVWHEPPSTTGRGTFVDELIAVAGGVNVFGDLRTPWPTVGLEEIVRRDPDYIVIPRGTGHSVSPEMLGELAGWRELSAVREGRIVTVDADLFNRPGPRVLEATHTLGQALRALGGMSGS